jgi:iron complex outermembrane recepter protein
MPAKEERNSFITDKLCSDYSAQNFFMKSLLSMVLLCATNFSFAQKQFNDTSYLQPVEVSSVKAAEKNPFAKTNLTKADIKKQNIGQDLPFILNNTPSVVVTSDAGNGVGYTGIRIRGTDATRINVTLNGIPYNDAESLGTYFVDMPDIASSASSIQIQRGVGTSANGAGSFGGSINVSTNELVKTQNFEANSSIGSYGLLKNTLLYNSGMLNKHFAIDARMSHISSDGYIDRATARLKSYFISAVYFNPKNTVRVNVFTGKEKTYQAYYGTLEDSLKNNRTYNSAGTEKPGTPYENQVDDYAQTHYQLFYTHTFTPYLKSNIAVFLTKGKGFYEQYKAAQKFSKYGLPNYGSIKKSDMINQLWLDNDFYGSIFSLQYEKKNTQLIVGAGYNRYEGAHFGKIIFATVQAAVPANYEWYNTPARKYDFSAYTKWTQTIGSHFQTFVDMQIRNVDYSIKGFRKNPTLNVNNPKAGITFYKNNMKVYASFGHATKEPNRDDFEAAATKLPKPEKLNDIEMGVEYKKSSTSLGANIYYMHYKDQLVLVGNVNDVGAYTRTNIDNSYRAGLELFGSATLNKTFAVSANVTLSKNKVKNFTENVDNYDNGTVKSTFYNEADISFSPNVIGSLSLEVTPLKHTSIVLTSKYVGKQYLDNTSNNSRKLKDFFTQDARVGYTFIGKNNSEVNIFLQGNNIFSKLYEANGYTASYISNGALVTENYYFPMAPATIMLGLNIRL